MQADVTFQNSIKFNKIKQKKSESEKVKINFFMLKK